MRKFQVLFEEGEPAAAQHAAFDVYGRLGFPTPPAERPWVFANFVQSIDGIASLRGQHAAGADISQSAEDRWLMDLLRAHADAVILGINTLMEEKTEKRARGAVFRIMEPSLRELRQRLGRGREKNIFVTGSAALDLSEYAAFDGQTVDALIVTTTIGAARLAEKKTHAQVRVIVAGEGNLVDLALAVRILRSEFGVRYLLCEGGPTLYGYMSRAGLIDEKFVTVSPVEAGQIIPAEQPATELDKKNSGPLGALRLRPTTFLAPGFTFEDLARWRWVSCRRVGDHQFSRYRRS